MKLSKRQAVRPRTVRLRVRVSEAVESGSLVAEAISGESINESDQRVKSWRPTDLHWSILS